MHIISEQAEKPNHSKLVCLEWYSPGHLPNASGCYESLTFLPFLSEFIFTVDHCSFPARNIQHGFALHEGCFSFRKMPQMNQQTSLRYRRLNYKERKEDLIGIRPTLLLGRIKLLLKLMWELILSLIRPAVAKTVNSCMLPPPFF